MTMIRRVGPARARPRICLALLRTSLAAATRSFLPPLICQGKIGRKKCCHPQEASKHQVLLCRHHLTTRPPPTCKLRANCEKQAGAEIDIIVANSEKMTGETPEVRSDKRRKKKKKEQQQQQQQCHQGHHGHQGKILSICIQTIYIGRNNQTLEKLRTSSSTVSL